MIEVHNIQVISYIVFTNKCSWYDCASKLNNEPELCDFPQKYEWSIKAMESVNALILTKYTFYKRVFQYSVGNI